MAAGHMAMMAKVMCAPMVMVVPAEPLRMRRLEVHEHQDGDDAEQSSDARGAPELGAGPEERRHWTLGGVWLSEHAEPLGDYFPEPMKGRHTFPRQRST